MIEPSAADIGRNVWRIAVAFGSKPEHGVISSINEHQVFVCFGDNEHSLPIGCRREDLFWDT